MKANEPVRVPFRVDYNINHKNEMLTVVFISQKKL